MTPDKLREMAETLIRERGFQHDERDVDAVRSVLLAAYWAGIEDAARSGEATIYDWTQQRQIFYNSDTALADLVVRKILEMIP